MHSRAAVNPPRRPAPFGGGLESQRPSVVATAGMVTDGQSPSGHVSWPPTTRADTRFADLQLNAFVCLPATGLLGLRVAEVDLGDFGGAKMLVVTCYDRGRVSHGDATSPVADPHA